MSALTKKSRTGKVVLCVVAVTAIAAVLSSGLASAQEPYFFPSKGQSNQQMEQDKLSCYQWAKSQTGFDPMQAPTPTAPAPYKSGSSPLRGAAGGAAMGAAVGAIAGDAGKGAAIGAASGGIIGGARRRQGEKEQQAYAQQQSASYSNQRNEYNRALGACMEGRGYSVK